MRVRIYSSDGVTPFSPLPHLDQCEAEMVPYVNKVTGKSDPLLVFTPPIRNVHESTLLAKGLVIKPV